MRNISKRNKNKKNLLRRKLQKGVPTDKTSECSLISPIILRSFSLYIAHYAKFWNFEYLEE